MNKHTYGKAKWQKIPFSLNYLLWIFQLIHILHLSKLWSCHKVALCLYSLMIWKIKTDIGLLLCILLAILSVFKGLLILWKKCSHNLTPFTDLGKWHHSQTAHTQNYWYNKIKWDTYNASSHIYSLSHLLTWL